MPDDERYDAERSGFQTARQHRPAVIAGPTSAADVRATVKFASAHQLPIAVQATGHGLVAAATDGVLVSTRRMTEVRIDPGAQAAWIGAGTRWSQVVKEAALSGLAPLNGSAPDVGAVSYTLGGGIGPLARPFGYAADHVREIELVTADGRLRRVTAAEDQELFWALRGGRGNYGVVTRMCIGLVPVTTLFGGGLYFGTELVADVLDAWRQWTNAVPAELTSSVALVPFPDTAAVAQQLRGRHVAHVRIAYTGSAAAGEKLIAPLRAVGPRLIDTVGQMPYTAVGSIHNDPVGPMAYRTTSAMLSTLDPVAVRALLDRAGPGAPDPVIIELRHLGGALAQQPAVANAVGHREARYLLVILSPLAPAGGRVYPVASVQERLLAEFDGQIIGRCLNFMHGEHSSAQVRSGYCLPDYERLTRIKAAYDPANLFCFDHNILPAG